ncbi:MAG: NAD(P)-binding domain-containing protein [Planctomycetota bacterium]|jgi:threonine dehydrogenase-like Zn-dependent dehydrogenase|nr:NAD(P)-binding domain-containing protein [Planctomycetota bacterium]MEC8304539.1 NAD(P)-binding domain-containing protein [Planctomycetota bacterium]MEC8782635.1 NAD(P)-binding domain-containing protein [Planctomycetota bacterium]
MAIDTPATIAILGAGPIGLEAALYARFLGYEVTVYEKGRVADHVRQWGHVTLFTPFHMNSSSLGRSAIETQAPDAPLPDSDAHLTGQQWVEEYLTRLTQVDLLRGNIREATEVLAVGKEGFLKSELVSHEERFEELQLVLARNAAGEENWQQFDIVIDTTGTFGVPNHLGPGGLPAAGESSLNRDQLWAHQSPPLSFRLPDIESEHRNSFAGKHTLVLGAGYSAATNLSKLLKLQSKERSTRITWAVRHSEATERDLVARFPDDALPRRDQLASEVNQAATDGRIQVLFNAQIKGLAPTDTGQWDVQFYDEAIEALQVDAILANVGFQGDWEITEETQLHRCYASGGPMKWSATLVNSATADCLSKTSQSSENLLTTEPNFYVLGSKSHGRWSNFLFQNGLEQIRMLFSVIADRTNLNLYQTPLSS